MGELVFEITTAGGRAVPDPVSVRISRSGGGHVLRLESDPGTDTYRCRVPADAWSVDVYPREAVGISPLSFKDHVIVPENEQARARVQFPPYGTLAVDGGSSRGSWSASMWEA